MNTLSPGVRHMLVSTFCFALMNLGVKLIPRIPTHEIVFFRSLGMLVLCGYLLKRSGLSFWGNHKLYLFLRGFYGTLGVLLYFFTLKHIPLASAVTLQYLSPVFSTIVAIFVLKESPPWFHWLFFFLSFSGVLVIKGFDPRVGGIYLFCGVLSPVFAALAYNYVRKLKDYDAPLVTVFYFPLVTLTLLSPYTLTHWVWPSMQELWVLVFIGVTTHIAQLSMTKAYQAERLSVVTNLNYLGMFYALALGYWFLGESMGWFAVGGMCLITSGVLLSQLYPGRPVLSDIKKEISEG